jgi:hypothetical protein
VVNAGTLYALITSGLPGRIYVVLIVTIASTGMHLWLSAAKTAGQSDMEVNTVYDTF